MKGAIRLSMISILIFSLSLLGSLAGAAGAAGSPQMATYRITINNLTQGQPFSPAVGATHRGGIRMFTVGGQASIGLEMIAEDGNQIPMFNRFSSAGNVTGVFGGAGMPPIPPAGSLSRMLPAHPGDRFSMATMLICTNDGFTGLDRAILPPDGAQMFWLNGYDAGTEDNTELSGDLVDACGALGPVPLPADGNEDAAIDTFPHNNIMHHMNITGAGDLTSSDHGWLDPVARVTVTRVGEGAKGFLARLRGGAENPPVVSNATGQARFRLVRGEDALRYRLIARDILDVTAAHIHFGLPDENGPVVTTLFTPSSPTGPVSGRLASGIIMEADLTGPFVGDFPAFLEALRNGEMYVNVHTLANPSGEIRGQVGIGPK